MAVNALIVTPAEFHVVHPLSNSAVVLPKAAAPSEPPVAATTRSLPWRTAAAVLVEAYETTLDGEIVRIVPVLSAPCVRSRNCS